MAPLREPQHGAFGRQARQRRAQQAQSSAPSLVSARVPRSESAPPQGIRPVWAPWVSPPQGSWPQRDCEANQIPQMQVLVLVEKREPGWESPGAEMPSPPQGLGAVRWWRRGPWWQQRVRALWLVLRQNAPPQGQARRVQTRLPAGPQRAHRWVRGWVSS